MDGVLVVDKPAGPTSHDVVDRVRRALDVHRAGHTGTLDPLATGVLPVCLGRATRLARFLAGGEKTYRAWVRLGFATTTDDAAGEPVSAPRPVRLEPEALRVALARLVGTFDQVPPAFSARRVGGRRLYELARRGTTVPRVATVVTVHELLLLASDGERLELEVRCSPGTYVRALARDLGESLGCGAHLEGLRRTRSGAFHLGQAVPGEGLSAEDRAHVLPLSALLTELPAVRVSEEGRRLVRHGRDVGRVATVGGFPEGGGDRVRILDESGELLALAVPRGPSSLPSGPGGEPTLHPDLVLVE